MDLYQLRYFLEVAREKSFTRAARNLYLSTPAMSKSIGLLEASLKRKLLARSRRHVELTSEGEYLKAKVQEIYDIIENVRMDFEGHGRGGPAMLRIGSREMISNYLLSPALLAFRKVYPQTRFGIHELEPRQMSGAIKKDLIDFGLYYFADISDPALEIEFLGGMSSHIYAAKSLLPKGKSPKTFEEVLRLPFIAPRYFQADPTQQSLDGFPDQKCPRNIQYEGEFLETHRRYVLDGIAAAVLPDFVVRQEWQKGEVVRLKGPKLGRQIYFFKRRNRPLPQAVDSFIKILKRSIRELAW
ncbi:MAG: LysR family transcriptional regulator [Elusimicrobia bacterium]|nr:LysR family transcriptional regulator [Elusimicrobiota bacterium]